MEVLRKNQKNLALLSNYEVLKLLNELKGQTSQNQAHSGHLATVLYEASHFLQDLPCSKQSDSDINGLLQGLMDFHVKLTRTEKLMIVNNPPKSQLQLSVVVKDLEERLNEEQIQSLLEIVSEHLSSSIE